jgi:methionine synthase II (cobalamin-independent)
MTRGEKSPEKAALAKEKEATSKFLKRVKQAKLDLPANRDMISGLFENSHWVFICSQHLSGRYADEQELKKHFSEKSHTRRTQRI